MTVKPTEQDVSEKLNLLAGQALPVLLLGRDTRHDLGIQQGQHRTLNHIISRLDRMKGETKNWVTGPGGAVRPTPSPDGNRLAFIAAKRFKGVSLRAGHRDGRGS